MPIAALVPTPIASVEHGDTVLELAFLMSATDGYLADEELDAFRELVGVVRGRAVTKDEVDTLLGRFLVEANNAGVDERVKAIASTVPPPLRETAYRVAVGLALVDHDESEYEEELADLLASSLGVAERATALTKEARVALAS